MTKWDYKKILTSPCKTFFLNPWNKINPIPPPQHYQKKKSPKLDHICMIVSVATQNPWTEKTRLTTLKKTLNNLRNHLNNHWISLTILTYNVFSINIYVVMISSPSSSLLVSYSPPFKPVSFSISSTILHFCEYSLYKFSLYTHKNVSLHKISMYIFEENLLVYLFNTCSLYVLVIPFFFFN